MANAMTRDMASILGTRRAREQLSDKLRGEPGESAAMSDFDKPSTTVLSVGNRAVAVEVRGFGVEVVAGPDAGKSALARGRSLEIGAHSSSDLVLTDEHVSRRHLRIDAEARGGCVLYDLGSTNGTRIGGVRVRVAPLEDGAIIECGESRLRFSFRDAPVRVPLAERDDFEVAVQIGLGEPLDEIQCQGTHRGNITPIWT
ncbi:MAG TPA: FHA domain-containing protein, partial [Polyangia bacterium]